jgi:hypothetical protein
VEEAKNAGVSKVKIALGAASLFLFLVGLKRSFRTDEGKEILSSGEQAAADQAAVEQAAAARRSRSRASAG